MSRGLGVVERKILEAMRPRKYRCDTSWLTIAVFMPEFVDPESGDVDYNAPRPTDSQRKSTIRACASLERKGLIVSEKRKSRSYYSGGTTWYKAYVLTPVQIRTGVNV